MSVTKSSTNLSRQDYFAFSRGLEDYNRLFSKIWEMGYPVFTKAIDTAAVSFHRDTGGFLNFMFNPDFWDNLDDYTRRFIICHEALHIILQHGKRGKGLNPKAANIAMDIVVNNLLVNKFGFERNLLKTPVPKDENGNPVPVIGTNGQPVVYVNEEETPTLVWIDRVFPNNPISAFHNFEYYYGLIMEKAEQNGGEVGHFGNLADSHDFLGGLSEEELEAKINEIAKELSEKERENLRNMMKKHLPPGTQPGEAWFMTDFKVSYKTKWENVITDWSRTAEKPGPIIEDWTQEARRMMSWENNFMLPRQIELEKYLQKIQVWFFMDTSGSCVEYASRFFTAMRSLDPEKFEAVPFCFDTKIYPMSEKDVKTGKIYGGGGTSFHIIEDYIQMKMKKDNINYPDTIWMITDGYGDNVIPQKPERWRVFITENGARDCFPQGVKTYDLAAYE